MDRSREILTDKLIISDYINNISEVIGIAESKDGFSVSISA